MDCLTGRNPLPEYRVTNRMPTLPSDEEIVRRIRESQEAFGLLVERYHRMVFAIALARVRDRPRQAPRPGLFPLRLGPPPAPFREGDAGKRHGGSGLRSRPSRRHRSVTGAGKRRLTKKPPPRAGHFPTGLEASGV